MTILTVLLALLIAHFSRRLEEWRNYRHVVAGLERLQNRVVGRWPDQGWLGAAVLVLLVALFAAVLVWVFDALLGKFGLFILSLAVLLYTLGPRDLDRQVTEIAESEDEHRRQCLLDDLGPPAQPPAARVFHAALWRWFGIIFWFTVLGIAGALLYRLAEQTGRTPAVPEEPGVGVREPALDSAMARLRAILAWPVAQLMSLALMLASDFDRTLMAWKGWMTRHGWMTPGDGMLLSAGLEAAGPEPGIESMLRAMELAWRMLIIWLVILSLMLIVGWLA